MTALNGLVGIRDLPAETITRLLDTAEVLRVQVRDFGNLDLLRGRAIALLFMEPSTRTRCSFEMAAIRLGAHPLTLPVASSSAKKGESLLDTARLLEAVGADALVVRHPEEGAAAQLSQGLTIPVFNAGDGANEHPTQALLDALTLRDALRHFEGKTVAIVGDVRHSRVARSNCLLLPKLGARVVLAGPPELCPDHLASELGVEVVHDLDTAMGDADAVMMLRIQRERMDDTALDTAAYIRDWRLDSERLARHPGVVAVLHPAPMNRGVEITSEVADGPRSVIFEQMRNGVFTRMAALLLSLPKS